MSHQFWWFVQPFLTWFTGEHIVSLIRLSIRQLQAGLMSESWN